VAINRAHIERGFASPTQSTLVADTLRGIRRINGSKQRQVMPLLKADLVKITKKLSGLIGLRDKASAADRLCRSISPFGIGCLASGRCAVCD
jgi:hypothetical protein